MFSRPTKITDEISGFGGFSLKNLLIFVGISMFGILILSEIIHQPLRLPFQIVFPFMTAFWLLPSVHRPGETNIKTLVVLFMRRSHTYVHNHIEIQKTGSEQL